jgi:hypothetical protein
LPNLPAQIREPDGPRHKYLAQYPYHGAPHTPNEYHALLSHFFTKESVIIANFLQI